MRRSQRHGRKSSETAGGAADALRDSHVVEDGSSLLMIDQEFFNKGLMVFDAVSLASSPAPFSSYLFLLPLVFLYTAESFGFVFSVVRARVIVGERNIFCV